MSIALLRHKFSSCGFPIVSTSPAPLPTLVNITVKIKEVISINEEKQTMTIKFRFSLGWYDSRLHVTRSDDYTER